MEADWSETTRIAFPGPSPNVSPGAVTTFAFDNSQELLWTGNEYVSETAVILFLSFARDPQSTALWSPARNAQAF